MGATTVLTMEQFADLPEEPGKQELLKGELIRVPPPKFRHSWIQRRVVEILSAYANEHRNGEVFTNTGFQLADDTCLEPDVAFVTNEQLQHVDFDGWLRGAPILAVEILSRSNTAAEMDDKVRAYLDSGASSVWVINPKRSRLTAYYRDGRFEVFETPSRDETASRDLVEERGHFRDLRFPLSALFKGLE